MSIPPEISASIARRLNEFIGGVSPEEFNLRRLAAQFGALPLLIDQGTCYAIRVSDEIVGVSLDPPHIPHVEHGERRRLIALYHGSQRYPELSALVGERPANARVCSVCAGTGVVPVARAWTRAPMRLWQSRVGSLSQPR